MEEQKKIGYHHKKVEIYATTFLMPIIFYITLFVWEGIYPFGEKSNLIWDLEVQYVDYYNFFREFLKIIWAVLSVIFHHLSLSII